MPAVALANFCDRNELEQLVKIDEESLLVELIDVLAVELVIVLEDVGDLNVLFFFSKSSSWDDERSLLSPFSSSCLALKILIKFILKVILFHIKQHQ